MYKLITDILAENNMEDFGIVMNSIHEIEGEENVFGFRASFMNCPFSCEDYYLNIKTRKIEL